MIIKSCSYNIDYDSICVIYDTGFIRTLFCTPILESLDITYIQKSRFYWLIENQIKYFVEMVLDGSLQNYLNDYQNEYLNKEKRIVDKLKTQYNQSTADSIAREFMMYQDLY